eukprot:Seg377.9 transcript_id=Seg377.9/GoldUCD/mRNA.D3Y31 product="DEAD-box ATP-dependent RNA helicase 13" protein_id=Seg377.9/GoldUCD/D3Y31
MAATAKRNKMKKQLRKRSWKTVAVKEEDIFGFEEGGFRSLEEITDYDPSEFGGNLTEFRPSPVDDEEGPIKRKKAKTATEENQKDEQALSFAKVESKKKKTAATKRKRKKQKRKEFKNKQENLEVDDQESEERGLKQASHEVPRDGQEMGEKKSSEASEQDNRPSNDSTDSNEVNLKCDMSDWAGLGVPNQLLAALSEKGFDQPTPIQSATLPVAIFNHQDVIGAAETGSGKTLAFALPVLTHILDLKHTAESKQENKLIQEDKEKPLYALILTPTRELALQVYKHVNDLTKYIPVKCAAIVGGLSSHKQERILSKCPEVVIGTPGRLLNFINDGEPHLKKIGKIKFLVIDEVDRMLEFGHFKEASEILRLISLSKGKWQTFLFSATLTVPRYHKKQSSKRRDKDGEESVQKLVDKANVSSKAKIIDLSSQHIAAEQIDQRRIICTEEEKDLYLLYITLCHPGRTLIFVNSINCTRKITNFLAILGKNPLQLHAGKQQKQRFKALERFMGSENAIMVATDVAARGLDVPNVDTIIHYHLPKDPRIYIHRSGRTARAKKGGHSIILEGPQDFKEYRKIYDLMKLDQEIPSLEVDLRLLPDIKKRVTLARKIDREEHQQRKKSTEEKWFEKAAKSLDLELEDKRHDDSGLPKKKESNLLKSLRNELKDLLKLPLVPKGFSGSYITKSGKLEKLTA